MKPVKMKIAPVLAGCIAFGLSSAAFGANWYVSSDGSWDPDGLGNKETKITDAIAKASPGDTIWVKNNFVCTNETSTSKDGSKNNLVISKAVTVRSEYGYVDEANNVWAKICGRYNSASSPCGGNGTRCVYMTTGATLVGFVLESGATSNYDHASYPGGGAIFGVGTVSNCVIRNCWGTTGGAIRNNATSLSDCLTLENCVITNNTARFNGAGISGLSILRHCDISFNKVTPGNQNGGVVRGYSNAKRSLMYDCGVSNNTYTYSTMTAPGGGLLWVNAFGSKICNNKVDGNGGGAANCALSGCVVKGNVANGTGSNGGHGGGLYKCTATNCIIVLNRAPTGGASCGQGGGAYNCDLYNCQVISNKVKDCSYTDYRGTAAGLHCTEPHVCYNTLFFGQSMTEQGFAAVMSSDTSAKVRLVNCTITGNSSKGTYGGCYNVDLVNTIVSGNTGTECAGAIVATNSCATVLTDAVKYPGCITEAPKFIGTGDYPYALSARSPCRDKGFYDKDDPAWGWVTNPDDPRSRDLAGKPRLAGKGLDMGCYEYVLPGFLLLVR